MELTSVKTIKDIQNRFGFTFKKGLGQNFLTSQAVLDDIVAAADCKDGAIEIGPGFGVLTRELLKVSKKVVAIEIDERLIEVLDYTLNDFDNVKVINADVLKLNINELIENEFGDAEISIAANLPYYITTPIIAKLLEAKLAVKNIVVMVQKEVAMRFLAKPATKDYGAISLMCQYFAKPQLVTTVKASSFVPPPKVDSAVVKFEILKTPPVLVKSEDIFFKTVKAAFSQRRKTLLNCISSFFGIPKDEIKILMESCNIDPLRRGETLSMAEFAALSDAIWKIKNY